MATSRVVNTEFWKDTYISDLEPYEKLVFIYCFTNPRTTLAGIYEINIKEIAFDTGLEKSDILTILSKFEVAGKMHYEQNWLILSNFIKHQRLNPSIIRGVEKSLGELPDWLQEKIEFKSVEDNQMELFYTNKQQTDNTLGTVTPQYKEIKRNIKKVKEKSSEQTVNSLPEKTNTPFYGSFKSRTKVKPLDDREEMKRKYA